MGARPCTGTAASAASAVVGCAELTAASVAVSVRRPVTGLTAADDGAVSAVSASASASSAASVAASGSSVGEVLAVLDVLAAAAADVADAGSGAGAVAAPMVRAATPAAATH